MYFLHVSSCQIHFLCLLRWKERNPRLNKSGVQIHLNLVTITLLHTMHIDMQSASSLLISSVMHSSLTCFFMLCHPSFLPLSFNLSLMAFSRHDHPLSSRHYHPLSSRHYHPLSSRHDHPHPQGMTILYPQHMTICYPQHMTILYPQHMTIPMNTVCNIHMIYYFIQRHLNVKSLALFYLTAVLHTLLSPWISLAFSEFPFCFLFLSYVCANQSHFA